MLTRMPVTWEEGIEVNHAGVRARGVYLLGVRCVYLWLVHLGLGHCIPLVGASGIGA